MVSFILNDFGGSVVPLSISSIFSTENLNYLSNQIKMEN